MAIIGTQDDDDKKNVVAQPTTSSSPNAHAAWDSASGAPYQGAGGTGGLVGGSGTGNGQGVTTSGGATTGAASPNPGGGGFTNLSQYLAVNQGSGATTGQAGANVVQQGTDAATSAQGAYNTAATGDINAATTAAGVQQGQLDKVAAGTQNVDKATMDKINASGYTYGGPANLSLAGLPTESQDDLNKEIQTGVDAGKWSYGGPTDFSKVQYGGPQIADITTQYGGPQSVSDFKGDTAGKQTAALSANDWATGESSKAGGGQTGVASLLRDAYQQPNYSKGENNLDAFLAGGTQGGQDALGKAAGMGKGVTDAYSGIQNALGTAIQGGKDTAAATNKAYQDAIDKGVNTSKATQDAYNAQVAATQKSSADAVKAAQEAAKGAQGESDKRAAAAAAEAAAAKAKQDAADAEAAKQKQKDSVLGKLEAAGQKIGNPILSDLKNLPNNLAGLPKNLADQIKGALAGDQSSINALATTIATGGLSTLAPAATKGVTDTLATARDQTVNAAQKAGTDTVNAVKAAPAAVANTVKTVAQNAGNAVSNVGKQAVAAVSNPSKWHFAHGGEIPDPKEYCNGGRIDKMAKGGRVPYGSLVAKLRGK